MLEDERGHLLREGGICCRPTSVAGLWTTPADLDRAFAEIAAKKCEALFVFAAAEHNGPANSFARTKVEIARCLSGT
jgi:hypothetical protein